MNNATTDSMHKYNEHHTVATVNNVRQQAIVWFKNSTWTYISDRWLSYQISFPSSDKWYIYDNLIHQHFLSLASIFIFTRSLLMMWLSIHGRFRHSVALPHILPSTTSHKNYMSQLSRCVLSIIPNIFDKCGPFNFLPILSVVKTVVMD